LMVMVPSPSLSNNENASLNSAICSSERLSMGVGVGVGVGVWGVSRSWLWGGFCGFQGEPAHCTAPYFHRTSTPLPPHFHPTSQRTSQRRQCSAVRQARKGHVRPPTHHTTPTPSDLPSRTNNTFPTWCCLSHCSKFSGLCLSWVALLLLVCVSFAPLID
jgi:hypothetical protein